jgi:hypothetical protein
MQLQCFKDLERQDKETTRNNHIRLAIPGQQLKYHPVIKHGNGTATGLMIFPANV